MDAPQIISDPNVLLGKPVIAGTRISVELILEKLGAGESIEDLLEAYPHVNREAILAAIRFAASIVHELMPAVVSSAIPRFQAPAWERGR
jgi:uncharacterized protein (DUF433 family)